MTRRSCHHQAFASSHAAKQTEGDVEHKQPVYHARHFCKEMTTWLPDVHDSIIDVDPVLDLVELLDAHDIRRQPGNIRPRKMNGSRHR